MIDSFGHLLNCTGLEMPVLLSDPSEEEEEGMYGFLEELAFHAYTVNPGYPAPLRTEDSGELELYSGGGNGESSARSGETDSLHFEIDAE